MGLKILAIVLVLLNKRCFGFEISDEEYDKMPPLFRLDEYHKCIRYDGVYCQIKLDLFAEPENGLMTFIKDYSESTHLRHYNHSYLEEGICVTTTCKDYIRDRNLDDPEDVKSIIEECRNDSIWQEYGLQARVSLVYNCDRKTDQSQVDLLDWLVLGLLITIVLINVTATTYDCMLDDNAKVNLSKGQRIFLCFSVIRNWKYLKSPPSTDPKISIFKGINAMRTVTSFLVILAHVVCVFTLGSVYNTHEYEQSFSLPHFKILWHGMHSVQMFFVMSGLLLAYNMQAGSETKKITWKMVPYILLHRFWRLTPGFAVMLAFTATWLRHLGSGPLWTKQVVSVSAQCRQYWWTHLLYINNYFSDNVVCAVHTWYSAADTQMFYIGIVVHILTVAQHRSLVLGGLVVLGMILPALHAWYYDLHALMVFSPEFARTINTADFRLLYIIGHNNIICYVFGMYAGYKLYDYRKNGITLAGNKVHKYIYWSCIPAIIGLALVGSIFYGPTPLLVRMLYQSTHRIVIGGAAVYLIMGFTMKLDTFLTSIFDWDGWAVSGRLTYTVYLLHMNIIHYLIGSKSVLIEVKYFSLMLLLFGVLVMSYLISIPFYLMVEAPMDPILKLILAKNDDKSIPDHGKSNASEVKKKADLFQKEIQKELINTGVNKPVKEDNKNK